MLSFICSSINQKHKESVHVDKSVKQFICSNMLLFKMKKMWKEKDHYPLTMKQVVSYPQNDRKSEMLVTGNLKHKNQIKHIKLIWSVII